ncbi:MAG TPA: Rid family hydrolase [Vicinamibacterales bacterium]|nr:Rid family hydrolase [Vicinamibacterales bacterium]
MSHMLLPLFAGAILLTAMQMPARQIVTAGPAPVGPYSPAVKAGGFIYVSGTLAQDSAGAIVGKGDVAAQTRRVLERMREVLAAAGSSLDQAVAVAVYLKSAGDFGAMNEVYKSFWTRDPPTRTTVITDLVLPDALIEVSMIAVPTGAERVVVHPADWMKSPNPYSYAIRSGDTLFLAGLVSRNGRDNSVVAGDITAQTRVVMDNAGELLKAAGMSYANVVSTRVFLPDTANFQQMNAAYRSYFPSAPPARATVRAGLAGSQYAVEITLVASAAAREAVSDGRPANPNLSPAIRAGNHVYVAGMLGSTADNKGDAAAQTRETLDRIRRALEAAGCAPADVVDAVVYLTDLGNFRAMNEAYRPFFGKDFPARTTVQTGLVAPDGLVEIMVTAVKR